MTTTTFFSQSLGEFLSYLLLTMLMQNMIFARALGSSTALWVIRKKFNFIIFGGILTFITVISSILSYLLLPYLVDSPYHFYLAPLVYISIVAVVYLMTLILAGLLPLRQKNMVLMVIHRSAFNCTVLGVLLLLGTEFKDLSLGGFIGFSIGSGLGFTLALYLVSIAYDRLHSYHISKSFRGFPATLFYLGILSMAIYGMIGHELPI